MPFVKVVKNKAYYKRFQTKYRRRREGKTDYYARKRLITQAKNKYNSPKYRFVVRITGKQVICQVIYAQIKGDFVMASAYSTELPKYGINNGLSNWSAAYATGLLCARRVLTKLGLADSYTGNDDVTGEYYEVEQEEDAPRPFKAYLDVGLRRTTTGSRIFGALKGAVDGGVAIPYSEGRFPGWDAEDKELDAELLKSYIFGGHIAEYMEYLEEEDEEAYKAQFHKYIAEEIGPDDIEELFEKAHEAIRENPMRESTYVKKTEEEKVQLRKFKQTRRNLKQRNDRVKQRKAAFMAALAADEE